MHKVRKGFITFTYMHNQPLLQGTKIIFIKALGTAGDVPDKRLELRKQQDLITMHDSKPHIPQAVGASKAATEKLLGMTQAKEAIKKDGVKYYE